MPAIQTLALSALIGVVVGNVMHDELGGKRSSIGVHRPSGKLMSFPQAIVFFTVITIAISGMSGVVSSISAQILGKNIALLIALALVILLLADSYSR